MNWTKAQNNAITNRDKNLLVSAGAGCGKTAVLTNRIISLMLETKTDIDSFVVATFTKAAAAQMKDKIRKLLNAELNKNSAAMRNFIYKQISLLDNANISTIHSFCIKILREYYYILEIDPSFKIIDDTSASLIQNEELDKIFESHYAENDNDFINIALSYSNGRDDASFKELLTEIYRFIYNRPNPMVWLHKQIEKFNPVNKPTDFENTEAIKIIKNAIRDNLEQALTLNEKAKSLTRNLMAKENINNDKLIEFLITEESLIKTLLSLLESNFKAFLEYSKKPFNRFPRTKLKKENKDAIKAFRDQSKSYTESALSYLTFSLYDLEEISSSLYEPMKKIEKILIEFDKNLRKRKSDEGLMEFSDIEHLTIKTLLNTEVNEKIKKQFKYIFVDEYQDTNLVQEEIINLLCVENNLFAVGDIKQSIYRFRQAEPSIFYERYKSYKNDITTTNELIFMQTNFRSSPNIINGLNYLFKNLMSEQIGGIHYTKNESLESGKDSFSNLKTEIHLLEPEEENGTFSEDIETLKGDEVEITHAMNTVTNLLKTGMIYDKELKQNRKIQAKDICILSRNDKNITQTVSDIFGHNSVPIKVSKEANYYETPEIELIKDILKITNNFRDDITLLSIMRSFIFNFTPDELLQIRLTFDKKELSFYHECVLAYLENGKTLNNEIYKKIKNLDFIIEDFKEKALYMDTPSLIRYIYNKTHLIDYMSALPFGEKKKSNLETFIVLAMQYESFSNSGLYGFLNFIEYAKISGKQGDIKSGINSDENAVTFMSIHKSKGLEFPVVILIGAGKSLITKNAFSSQILLNKDLGLGPEYINLKGKYRVDSAQRIACKILEEQELLSEEMRLLYVALTRAEEKLIITGRIKETRSGLSTINSTIPSKAKTFLDWIGYALDINIDELTHNNTENFKIIRKKLPSLEENIAIAKKTVKSNLDENIIQEIQSHLNFKYAKSSHEIPSKLAVSEISDEMLLEVGENIITITDTPNFMIKKTEYDAIKKGNLIHFILEIIDLNELSKEDINLSIDLQIEKLLKDERITNSDLENLEKNLLYSFFKSSVGEKLLSAKKVYRELPFNLSIKAKDLSEKWSDSSEDVLIQGIIDCLFIEQNGNHIILDYKTGKSNIHNKEVYHKYKKQILLYSTAIEEILSKKVSKAYLCFLNENKYTEVI